jgi:ATP-binding cassette, subfamily F, member 2
LFVGWLVCLLWWFGLQKALDTVFNGLSLETKDESDGRVATGHLISEPRARDIKINAFSLSLHGRVLVEDTMIELNRGARYGLIGRNGCGKSTLLRTLAAREVPIPSHFSSYLLAHEADPGEETALEYVVQSAQNEIIKIDEEIETILSTEGPESEALLDLYDQLDSLDASTFETRAATILVGLGFQQSASSKGTKGGAALDTQTKDMSGGWRMRVALAKALFLAPSLLFLDEPTNRKSTELNCVFPCNFLIFPVLRS